MHKCYSSMYALFEPLFQVTYFYAEKAPPTEKDGRKRETIEGFYLFKALCKKILGRTDFISQDHSVIAKGDVIAINNVSRAIPPDLLISSQIVTALKSRSIKPQCEFVVSMEFGTLLYRSD